MSLDYSDDDMVVATTDQPRGGGALRRRGRRPGRKSGRPSTEIPPLAVDAVPQALTWLQTTFATQVDSISREDIERLMGLVKSSGGDETTMRAVIDGLMKRASVLDPTAEKNIGTRAGFIMKATRFLERHANATQDVERALNVLLVMIDQARDNMAQFDQQAIDVLLRIVKDYYKRDGDGQGVDLLALQLLDTLSCDDSCVKSWDGMEGGYQYILDLVLGAKDEEDT